MLKPVSSALYMFSGGIFLVPLSSSNKMGFRTEKKVATLALLKPCALWIEVASGVRIESSLCRAIKSRNHFRPAISF